MIKIGSLPNFNMDGLSIGSLKQQATGSIKDSISEKIDLIKNPKELLGKAKESVQNKISETSELKNKIVSTTNTISNNTKGNTISEKINNFDLETAIKSVKIEGMDELPIDIDEIASMARNALNNNFE